MVRRDVSATMKVQYLRMVRRAFRALRHPKLRHRPWWQKISKPLFHRSLWVPCRDTVASGLAIGLFFSMMPFIPQSIIAAILAMRAKVNVPFAMGACFVSNPLTNVPFWYAQIHVGQWLIDFLSLPVLPGQITLPMVGVVSASNWIVGFMAMGVLLSLSAYPIVHLFSAILPRYLPVRRDGIRPARAAVKPLERTDGQ